MMNDTIAAIATPFGSGGIGIIRISGDEAFAVASKLFSSSKSKRICPEFEHRKVYHGYILERGSSDVIDEIILIPMRGPGSYTAQDVIEIQAHAGNIVLHTILDQVLNCGARLAEPGEFTRQAFLNGRIDLTQAEAVADIISAKSASALKFSASQHVGFLRDQINQMRDQLIELLSLIEVNIDFPDETEPFEPAENERLLIDGIIASCSEFIKLHDDASFLKDGIKITICGAPNVGKSSLMNRLLEKERSIVTKIPGTTRDPVEEGMNIDGIPFVIADTAGIHKTDDLVEIIGIEKARKHINASDIVLFMKEPGSRFTGAELEKIIPPAVQEKVKIIVVINKIDIKEKPLPEISEKYSHLPVVKISALLNSGIKELKRKIVDMCIADLNPEKSSIIPNLRHKKALEETIAALNSVKNGLNQGFDEEIIAIDIKKSIDCLGSITGETTSLDILDTIFSSFCIGK